MPAWLSAEPALWIAFIDTLLILGVAFGLPLTDTEKAAIDAVLVAGSGLIVRSQVTPTAKLPPPP